MSLTVKAVYRARSFIVAPYRYDVASDCWHVAVPIAKCAKAGIDSSTACRVVKGRQRIRQVGPSHPLWVLKCQVHNCWFTVYPPGWLPFGRRNVLELDPLGEAVLGNDCWENTAFGAALDQGRQRHWPQTFAGLLKSALKGIFYYGTRRTQLRHIKGGAQLLGLYEGDIRYQQTVRLELGIEQRSYQEACTRIRDGPGTSALGAACTGILANLAQPSMHLFMKIVHLGHELGFWGICAHH